MDDNPEPVKYATSYTVKIGPGPPVPPPPLSGACHKVNRADRHIADFEFLFSRYVASRPILFSNIVTTTEAQGVDVIRPGIEKLEYPNLDIGTVVGDAIHNLRSSLDLMACDLAILNNKSSKGVYFPFAESEIELKEMIGRKHFNRTGQDCVSLLRTFKPWKGGNRALRALHDLDILDKHSVVIPAVTIASSEPMAMYTDVDGLKGTGIAPSEIVWSFPDPGPLAGEPIIPTLHHLSQTVKGILEAFAALVSNRS